MKPQIPLVCSPHLFAAEVVQKLDVTGMKGLPCVHRHQYYLVSNHHLQPKYTELYPKQTQRFMDAKLRLKAQVSMHEVYLRYVNIPLLKTRCHVQQQQAFSGETGQFVLWRVHMNGHRDTAKGAQQLVYHCLQSVKSPASLKIDTRGLSISTQDKQTSFQNWVRYAVGSSTWEVTTEGMIENETLKACMQ